MHGLWLENQTLEIRKQVPDPRIEAGEALLKLRLGGICSTDLEMVRGYYPFRGVPGHEFVGEVVSAPDDRFTAGQRVVGEINLVCHQCSACRNGRSTHCEQRTVLGILNKDGAFAEYLTLPVENLHAVPDSVPDELAVLVEPLAAALEIQQQIAVRPSDRVLVVGAGRLGQLIAQTLALTGCELGVVVRREKARRLLDDSGARFYNEDNVPAGAFDIVVEATGSASGFDLARRAVRARGTMVLKSTYAGSLTVDASRLVVDEIQLIGSRCGPFEPALRLLESKTINPAGLIEKSFPLSSGLEAFALAAQPGMLKVLLHPG